MDAYAAALRSAESLPPPAPPALLADSVSQSSLAVDLSEDGILPFPVGIVQSLECQYTRVTDEDEVPRLLTHLHDHDTCLIHIERLHQDSSAFRWNVMRSRHYYRKDFLREELSQQRPGSAFRFRVRYSTYSSTSNNGPSFWSPFSQPSAVYRTLPDIPSASDSLRLAAITSNSAHVTWDSWDQCQHLLNGAAFGIHTCNTCIHYCTVLYCTVLYCISVL
jgi:hypothetical protein